MNKIKELQKIINKKLKKSILTHSRPSKIMLLLGVLSVFLSLINRVSAPLILIEIFLYLTIAMTTNCMVYGKCRAAAYISIAIPTFFIFVNILSFLDVEIPVPDFFKKDNLIPDEKYLFKNEEEKQEYIQNLKETVGEMKELIDLDKEEDMDEDMDEDDEDMDEDDEDDEDVDDEDVDEVDEVDEEEDN